MERLAPIPRAGRRRLANRFAELLVDRLGVGAGRVSRRLLAEADTWHEQMAGVTREVGSWVNLRLAGSALQRGYRLAAARYGFRAYQSEPRCLLGAPYVRSLERKATAPPRDYSPDEIVRLRTEGDQLLDANAGLRAELAGIRSSRVWPLLNLSCTVRARIDGLKRSH